MLLVATFLVTLALTVAISIRLSGGSSPCGEWLCDISVYAAYPKQGAQEVVFRMGISLLALECMVLSCARLKLTGNRMSEVLYAASITSLLAMAFIPCYASKWHFYSAGLTFAFLALAEKLDTCRDDDASSSLTCAG